LLPLLVVPACWRGWAAQAASTGNYSRLLIRQLAIAGAPATDGEIRRFFTDSGWQRFVIEDNTAFSDPARQLVISDAHRGNIILMEDGLLAPPAFLQNSSAGPPKPSSPQLRSR
jgi:hypothetical protein